MDRRVCGGAQLRQPINRHFFFFQSAAFLSGCFVFSYHLPVDHLKEQRTQVNI